MYKEQAADYFDRHPSSNECHITSDGRVFHTKGSAEGFTHGLKDKKIVSYTRAELEAPTADDSGDGTSDEIKIQALEALKNFDATTTSYEDIKALVKALNIESPSNSKVDLIAAIEAQKAIVNTVVNP